MQKVIKKDELINYIDSTITLLSDTVITTLGPNGTNVIINNSNSSPFITNDGATIASFIEDEDPITNTILTIIKEAALKTDSDVGDGTTTTICLLNAIYKNSKEMLKSPNDAMKLKEDFQISLNKILALLAKYSHKPTADELEKIATISANDQKIGHLITNFYLKSNKSSNIKIVENTNTSIDYVEIIPGFFLENTIASPYFIDSPTLTLSSPLVALFNQSILSTDKLNAVIKTALMDKKDLIILADNFDSAVINDILAINYEQENKIILFQNPEYGTRKLTLTKDLSIITSASKIDDYYLGKIKEFRYTKENITFIYENNGQLDKYIKEIEKELKSLTDDYDKQDIKNRLSKLTNTYGIIYVGGPTKLERREKKMRFTDALCALKSAEKGILPGSSLPLYKISEELDITSMSDMILSESIKSPLIQILKNSNIDYPKIINQIKQNNYQELYNAKTKTFESLKETNVFDSKVVLESALTNAVSIATLLLTTSHLVISTNNDKPLLLNTISDF